MLVNGSSPNKMQEKMGDNDDDFEDVQEDYKMIFVVRMDLKLALGKLAQLVATATLKAYKQIYALIEVDEFKEHAFYEWS